MAITVEEVRLAIAAAGANWEADETDFFRSLGPQPVTIPSGLLGLDVPAEEEEELLRAASNVVRFPQRPIPRSIDWRATPGLLTPIKHQGFCGSCTAFATCATMESSYISGLAVQEAIDLSEAHLFFCTGGFCGDGGGIAFHTALGFAQNTGVGLEKDFPYHAVDEPCQKLTPALKIIRTQMCRTMDDRKRAVSGKPVMAGMAVYEDFYPYKSGIYTHQHGVFKGNHAVMVVGYDDDEGCWIARNSWGTGFGMGGYFKIAYGQCGIDTQNPFFDIDVSVVGPTS